jgi:hypothetical protein
MPVDSRTRQSEPVAAPDGECLVALLAIPGRYRVLLGRYGTLEQLDDALRRRPAFEEWSALELIAHVADHLHASARRAVALMDGERDRRSRPLHIDAPRAGTNTAPTQAVLGALQASAADLAQALSRAALDGHASFARPDQPSYVVRARELLDLALHETENHLDDVETLLDTFANASPP